jgi:hypothetical protein
MSRLFTMISRYYNIPYVSAVYEISHYLSTLVNRPIYTNVLNIHVTENCILKRSALNYIVPTSVYAPYTYPRHEKVQEILHISLFHTEVHFYSQFARG